jgi:hypothetical protein
MAKSEPIEVIKFDETEILKDLPPSTILRLSNVANEEDLNDDDLYDEMISDIAQELNLYGTVRSLVVPRQGPGRLLVFAQFTSIEKAVVAKTEVQGRSFGKYNCTVMAYYYPEDLFLDKVYSVPEGYKAKAATANEDLD